MLRWLIGIILGEIIWESSNWQHIQRLKITILGANWQLFRLERIAKCSYFILSTQNIKFHWIVMKIKKFMLPIWWYKRDLFPLRNKYNVVFILNGNGLRGLIELFLWLRENMKIDQFRNVFKLMDVSSAEAYSDQPFQSPALFNVIYIAGIHFACTLVVARSGKLWQALRSSLTTFCFKQSMHEIWIHYESPLLGVWYWFKKYCF